MATSTMITVRARGARRFMRGSPTSKCALRGLRCAQVPVTAPPTANPDRFRSGTQKQPQQQQGELLPESAAYGKTEMPFWRQLRSTHQVPICQRRYWRGSQFGSATWIAMVIGHQPFRYDAVTASSARVAAVPYSPIVATTPFVKASGPQFTISGKPFYVAGTNW